MPPAARVSDATTHGTPLAPGPGSSNVLIGGMPAWRATIDQHMCPAVSITGPDGVGAVLMGSLTVLINNMPACRMGDIVVEKPGLAMGPANPIMMGCPTVMIGDVGMGGAGSPMAAAAGKAKTAAVATHSPVHNASKYSAPGTPAPAPPPPQVLVTPPVKKKKPPPPPATGTSKQIVCGITMDSLHVNCQHDGRTPKNGVLEVVGSLGGGDTITAKCGIIGTCGQHPVWEVGGYWQTEKVGTEISFSARDFKALGNSTSLLPVWLGDASPHVYNVSAAACSGPDYAFVVKAYPNDLQQVKFSTEIYKARLEKLHESIKEFLKKIVEHPVFEFPKASGSCQLQWKEDPKSNLAFYYWQLSLAFDPLLALGARFPLGPQAALPAAVREYVNAGFFVEVKGELALSVNGGQLNPPESEKGHFTGKGEGKITVTVGGSAFAGGDGDDAPFKVELSLQSGVGLEVTCFLEHKQPVVEVEVTAAGLQGNATLLFHAGWDCEKMYQVTLFDKQSVYKREFRPFDSQGATNTDE